MLRLYTILIRSLWVLLLLFVTISSINAQDVEEANLLYHQAIAVLKRGKTMHATRQLKKAIKENPIHDAAYLLLIKLYVHTGRSKKALPYIERLALVEATSPKRAIEKIYYVAYKEILEENFLTAQKQIKDAIVEAYKKQQFDFSMLSRCYNALGYLDVMQHLSEQGTQKKRIVEKRVLLNARLLFEEALRYQPKSQVAATNYNIINTALRQAPSKIESYQLIDLIPEKPLAALATKEEKPTLKADPALLPSGIVGITEALSAFYEIILMIDISGSMRLHSLSKQQFTRHRIMKNMVYALLNNLDANVLVGAVSVGGSCDQSPLMKLPTSQNRKAIATTLETIEADGHTPVNVALTHMPELYQSSNSKRAVLFITDGMESCDPEATCELSAWLGGQNIELHILTFLEEVGAPLEYKSYACMTQTSNGSINAISPKGDIEVRDFNFYIEEKLILPPLEQEKTEDAAIASIRVVKIF